MIFKCETQSIFLHNKHIHYNIQILWRKGTIIITAYIDNTAFDAALVQIIYDCPQGVRFDGAHDIVVFPLTYQRIVHISLDIIPVDVYPLEIEVIVLHRFYHSHRLLISVALLHFDGLFQFSAVHLDIVHQCHLTFLLGYFQHHTVVIGYDEFLSHLELSLSASLRHMYHDFVRQFPVHVHILDIEIFLYPALHEPRMDVEDVHPGPQL